MIQTATLQRDLHGEEIGLVGQRIFCDSCQSPANELDPTGPIRCEAIKIVDLASAQRRHNLPDGWLLDATRCREHAITALEHPTHGYGEALLDFRVTPVDDIGYVVDGPSLELLDHSPGDVGLYPIAPTVQDEQNALANREYGIWRVGRHVAKLDTDRQHGVWPLSWQVESTLAAGLYDPDAAQEWPSSTVDR